MPSDSGYFQINDIELNIPPQQISVDRQSTIHQWQTIRTRSSIKSNAGFSRIGITAKVVFTSTGNGFEKLRDIISQLRVTPFCYVENQYLRDAILGGSQDPSMVLALNQMQIIKDNETTNAIFVIFRFSWFNYFPYLPTWKYKQDFFNSIIVGNPMNSKPWKMLYRAEQEQTFRSRGGRKQYKKYGVPPSKLDGEFNISYTEYGSIIRTPENNALLKDIVALEELYFSVVNESLGDSEQPYAAAAKFVKSNLTHGEEVWEEMRQSFGNTTSQSQNLGPGSSLASAITKQLSPTNKDSRYSAITAWTPVNTNEGKPVYHKIDMAASPQKSSQKDDSILVFRQRGLDFPSVGLIVTGITISFENILAELPLVGHAYPTYQHIGSIDAVVNLSITTTSESGLHALSNLYGFVEDQSMRFRQVPQGHRNLSINNELINMCGVRDFIPMSMTMDTVPGQPGTYQAVLTLIDNPLDAETQEKIVPASSFLTDTDLRNKTSKILLEKLQLDDNLLDKSTINTDFVELQHWSTVTAIDKDGNPISVGEGLATEKLFSTGLNTALTIDRDQSFAIRQLERITGFYKFVSGGKSDTDGRHEEFRNLATTYGRALGFFWLEIANILQRVKRSGVSELYEGVQDYFLSLTNSGVPAIERIQEDVRVITDKQKVSLQSVKDLNKDYKKSVDQGRVAFDKFSNLHIPDKPAAQLKLEDKGRYLKQIDQAVNEWSRWSQQFLDKIILDGTAQELEQFKSIKEDLEKRASDNHGVGCYPDFPLQTVANMIENSTDESFRDVARQIRQASQKTDPLLHQVGLGVLLQPDFYLYNKQADDIGKIVPQEIITKAVNVIQSNQDSRTTEESNWLRDVYEAEVLEDKMAAQIKNDVLAGFEIDDAWTTKDENTGVTEGNLYKNRFPPTAEAVTFHPDTLNDDGQGLGCAILEHKNWSGKEMELPPVNEEWIRENAKAEKGKVIPGITTHKNRTDTVFEKNTELRPKKGHHEKIRHYFGSSSIALDLTYGGSANDRFLATLLVDPADQRNDADDILWHSPVPGNWQVYSLFGKRYKTPGAISKTPHPGIDLSAMGANRIERANLTRNQPIYAAADGIVTRAGWDTTGGGLIVIIRHKDISGSLTSIATAYMHLELNNEYTQKIIKDRSMGIQFKVKGGDRIGTCGNSGMRCDGRALNSTDSGQHLHFEVRVGVSREGGGRRVDPFSVPLLREKLRNNIPWTTFVRPGTSGIAIRMKERGIKPDDISGKTDTEGMLLKSIEQLEKDLHNGQGYSLLRAYPTFKLYFIESDLGERRRFGFDDFFQYSSVESIMHIRSRKIAADMVVFNITNVSGVLSNRRFKDTVETDASGKERSGGSSAKSGNKRASESVANPQNTNTVDENPITSLMLEPGIQVQLRLGYNNHPDELETVFNGVITDVKFTEHDDMAQVTCQSFAIELVQNYYGDAKTFGGFLSNTGLTGNLIEELMAMPEVAHFGRWEGNDATNSAYGILKKEWKPVPEPYDDNIFAPTPGKGLYGLFDSSTKYVLYQNTVWDTLQEMTLRHPSYVASAVPYKGQNGARMTMFFGVPDQLYFARDPTPKEERDLRRLKESVNQSKEETKNNRSPVDNATDASEQPTAEDAEVIQKGKGSSKESAGVKEARDHWLKSKMKNIALDQGYIKPFRNYHVATSTQHIIANNIESSSNVFNTVTLQYGDSAATANDTTRSLKFGDLETFTLKCDAAIYDEEVKEMFAQYHNCIGYEMAKQYCVGLLFYSMKESYRGELIMVGNPKIKPYDIVYVFDEYTDMFGPIEVEQVVHRFSQKNGFVTEITPDMVVHVNQHTTMSSSDCMGLIAEAALKKIGLEGVHSALSTTGGTAAIAAATGVATAAAGFGMIGGVALAAEIAFSPIANMFFNTSEHSLGQGGSGLFGLIGTFIFSKLITRTQLAHPFRYSPLVKHGRPMTGALPTKKTKGSFLQSVEGWFRESKEGVGLMLTDVYERFDPNSWYGKSQGDWDTVLKGER